MLPAPETSCLCVFSPSCPNSLPRAPFAADEIESLNKQLELIKSAPNCEAACKEIVKFVTDKAASDPLLSESIENPYRNATGNSGPCCVIA